MKDVKIMKVMKESFTIGGLLIAPILGVTVVTAAQQRQDASAIFAAMRTALGGEAALDAVQTFSVEGTVTETLSSFRKTFSLELLAILPDHFMYGRQVSEETCLGSYRLNPKINPRRFVVGRS